MDPALPIVGLWGLAPSSPDKIMRLDLAQIRQAQLALHEMAHWLQTCPDVSVPEAFHGLMHRTERLFSLEQQLMEAYDFPSRQAHLEQHARVLRGLHCVHGAVLKGECEQGRHAGGSLLMDWLSLHHDTIDAVLAVWIDYCQSGLIDPSDPLKRCGVTAH